MREALVTLRDIDEVIGSFVLGEEGTLLSRDMPTLFDDATLSYVGSRLTRLRSALECDDETFESCVSRFGAHLLVLKRAKDRTLCVLAGPGVNLQALHMGTNIVARRVAAAPPVRHATPPPIPDQARTKRSEPSVPAETKPLVPRMFRGRRVD